MPLSFARGRRKRILKIAEYLKELNPDIICLQEAWDAAHRRLLHDQLGPAYHALSSRLPLHRLLYRFSNARGGLFTLSKFPVVSEKFIPFSRLNHSVTEMLGNKGILESIIKTDQGTMRILNTHLHAAQGFWSPWLALGAWIRFKQLKKLINFAGSADGQPTILAGDFNEHAIIEQEQLARLLTYAGFVSPLVEEKLAPTFRRENIFAASWDSELGDSQRLDYILVRSLDGLAVADYQPVYLTPELSDHDPIVLTLTRKQ